MVKFICQTDIYLLVYCSTLLMVLSWMDLYIVECRFSTMIRLSFEKASSRPQEEKFSSCHLQSTCESGLTGFVTSGHAEKDSVAMERLRECLAAFEGHNPFHNYTVTCRCISASRDLYSVHAHAFMVANFTLTTLNLRVQRLIPTTPGTDPCTRRAICYAGRSVDCSSGLNLCDQKKGYTSSSDLLRLNAFR